MEEIAVLKADTVNKDEIQYKTLMLMYESALKIIDTKINIISNEIQMLYNYNPIEHTKTRLKSYNSIVGKMRFKLHYLPEKYFYAIIYKRLKK